MKYSIKCQSSLYITINVKDLSILLLLLIVVSDNKHLLLESCKHLFVNTSGNTENRKRKKATKPTMLPPPHYTLLISGEMHYFVIFCLDIL